MTEKEDLDSWIEIGKNDLKLSPGESRARSVNEHLNLNVIEDYAGKSFQHFLEEVKKPIKKKQQARSGRSIYDFNKKTINC